MRQRAQQPGGSLPRVSRLADCAYDRDARRPRANHRADVLLVDAADCEPRARRGLRCVGDKLDTDRVAPRLRRSCVDWPNADVVGAGSVGGVDLRRRMRRQSHQQFCAGLVARRGDERVVLTDVDAVCARRSRKIRAVVDDQQRARGIAEPARNAGRREQLVVARVLRT